MTHEDQNQNRKNLTTSRRDRSLIRHHSQSRAQYNKVRHVPSQRFFAAEGLSGNRNETAKALRKIFMTAKPDHLDTYFKVDRSGNEWDDATIETRKGLSHSWSFQIPSTNVVHQAAASILSEKPPSPSAYTLHRGDVGEICCLRIRHVEEVEKVFQTKSSSNVRNILPRRTERIGDHLKLALLLDEFSNQPSSHHLSLEHQ